MTSGSTHRPQRSHSVLLGERFTVEGCPEGLTLLQAAFSGVASDAPAAGGEVWRFETHGASVRTFHGDHVFGDFADLPTAVIDLAGNIELHAASTTTDFVAIHAGAVAVDGKALLLPGRSLAGKSTLTRALLGAGADYLSDEYALLDAEGNVHAYPRPLRLRRPGQASAVVPASELGPGAAPQGPLPVAVVAQLRHDAAGWQIEPLSGAQTTLALIDNAVPAQTRPSDTLTSCAAAARQARGITGTRGEAAETAALLIDLLRA